MAYCRNNVCKCLFTSYKPKKFYIITVAHSIALLLGFILIIVSTTIDENDLQTTLLIAGILIFFFTPIIYLVLFCKHLKCSSDREEGMKEHSEKEIKKG